MESEKQHFWHILLFYYRKGKNSVQARKKLSDVYGENVLTERQCQNWFAKFDPAILMLKMHHVLEGQLVKLMKTQ